MYIVILGAGKIGLPITKSLLDINHEVTLIDHNPTLCGKIDDELGNITVTGNGIDPYILDKAGLKRAEVFISTTKYDHINLLACQLVQNQFESTQTISIINNPQYLKLFDILGISSNINLTSLILETLHKKISQQSYLDQLVTLPDINNSKIIKIIIKENLLLENNNLSKITIPEDSQILLIITNEGIIELPTDQQNIEVGTQIIALTTTQSENQLIQKLQGESHNNE